MSNPFALFPAGMPITSLPARFRPAATALDEDTTISREGAEKKGDALLGLSELQFGVEHAGFAFHREACEMAEILGVSAAPRPREWQDRTAFEGLRIPRRVVQYGSQLVVHDADQQRELFLYDPTNDATGTIETPRIGGKIPEQYNLSVVAKWNDTLLWVSGTESGQVYPWVFKHQGGEWKHAGNLMKPVLLPAVAEYDGLMYAFGGAESRSGSIPTKPVTTGQVLNPKNGEKRWAKELPEARSGAGAIVVGDEIWIVGGRKADGKYSNRIDRYRPKTDDYGDPILLNHPVFSPSLWIEDGQLRVCGGEHQQYKPNTVLQSVEIDSGKVTGGEVYPGGGLEYVVFGQDANNRLFGFGRDKYKGRGSPTGKAWELVTKAPEPKPEPTTVNNVTINVVSSTVVQHVEHTEITAVTIDNTSYFDNSIHLEVAPCCELPGKARGFADAARGFFVKTEIAGVNTLQINELEDGQRRLYGPPANGRPVASPKEQVQKLFLAQPSSSGGSATVVPVERGRDGSLKATLPKNLHGECYLFGVTSDGKTTGAAVLQIP